MRSKDFFTLLVVLCGTTPLFAWGPEGHRIIGSAGFELLDESARQAVVSILGDPAADTMFDSLGGACNWPDTIREEPEWRWSSPLHYVNIPRHADHYDRERDCSEGRCVTEGILHFANQLTWPDLEPEKRWQAFAFVCHLVADLHQPLHAGFRDDRGGNTVDVVYRGDAWNLHQVWDGVIVRERLGDENSVVAELVEAGRGATRDDWSPGQVKAWTDESHALAIDAAYPGGSQVDAEFADRIWRVTLLQWERAALRLASVLNAALGDGETEPGD